MANNPPNLLSQMKEQTRLIMRDLYQLWRVLPHKSVFLVGSLGLVALFHLLGNSTFGYVDTHSVFSWMINAYNAPLSEDGHGNLIPFAVLALLVWKRKELLDTPSYGAWWPGFLILALGLLLHLVGYVAQQTRISVLGLFLGFYGLMGFCWGKSWMKVTFFPYVLFLFCVPVGSLAQPVTFPLRLLVSSVAAFLADNVLQIEVVRQGTLLMDAGETLTYDVAAACSGIRSLMTLVPLTLAFAFINYRAWWRRLFLMLLSVPFAVAGNTLRILIVIWIGNRFGQEVGLDWEQKLGLITFPIALGGIFLVDIWLREPSSMPDKKRAHAGEVGA